MVLSSPQRYVILSDLFCVQRSRFRYSTTSLYFPLGAVYFDILFDSQAVSPQLRYPVYSAWAMSRETETASAGKWQSGQEKAHRKMLLSLCNFPTTCLCPRGPYTHQSSSGSFPASSMIFFYIKLTSGMNSERLEINFGITNVLEQETLSDVGANEIQSRAQNCQDW